MEYWLKLRQFGDGEVIFLKGQAVQLSLHSVKAQKTFFLINKLPYPSTETVAHPYTAEKPVNLFTKSMQYSHILWGFFCFFCEEQKQMGHEVVTI